MRLRTFATITAVSAALLAAPATDRIIVSGDHHFFQTQSGAPFFWLADTAWLLFSKLNREETLRYLDDRSHKGFDVIQVMVLQNPEMKSAVGRAALINGDPAKPDVAGPGESYWDHIDWVVDRAAERGIYVALVPAWGSLVKGKQLNEKNAAAYGSFLAQRYKGRPNVFWIVGGDINGGDNTPVWNLLARALRAGDANHLITFHPFGRMQSSMWFHNEPWLDFNMFQSGHRRYDQDTDSPHKYGEDNWRYVNDDYARTPTKPVLDGEPSYEGIPQGLHDTTQPYWTDADARRYAYWSVFAGAAGHTYGDNAIMQFNRPGDSPGYGAKNVWTEALNDPGAGQLQYLKTLILSRPYFERHPDQSLLVGGNGAKHDYIAVTRGVSYAFVYSYSGRPFRLRMGAISGKGAVATWYSPRDGSTRPIETYPNRGELEFTPPGRPAEGNDWVLILDDLNKRFPMPGRQ